METAVLSLRLDVGENLEDREEAGMRHTALFYLDLNKWHEDEGKKDGGRHSRRMQTPIHTRNQEVEDVVVPSPRRHETRQRSREVR
jgi:hypothetical protein